MAVTAEGGVVVAGSDDGTIRVWDLATGRCARLLEGHANTVRTVVLTPDGQYAVSGSEDGTIRVWDLPTGRCAHVLVDHRDSVRGRLDTGWPIHRVGLGR